MAHWLFKSEPDCFSFADLMAAKGKTTGWDGVRNYQARNYLRDGCKKGDLVLFYHSSADPPAVVGIAEVVKEAESTFEELVVHLVEADLARLGSESVA